MRDSKTLVIAKTMTLSVNEHCFELRAAGRTEGLTFSDVRLFRVLQAFARAEQNNDEEVATDALSTCPLDECPFEEPAMMERLIELLKAAGLLAAGDRPVIDRQSPATRRVVAEVGEHIVALVSTLLCDIEAFGHTYAVAGLPLGVSVLRRFQLVAAVLDSMESDLIDRRGVYTGGQLKNLGIAPSAKNLKLHVGCGSSRIPEWLNIDVSPAELALDVRWGLPFADGAATHIFFSHTLEHLRYPNEALFVLREMRRVLAPGGVLRIVVPDMDQCLSAYTNDNRAFFDARKAVWKRWPESATRLEAILGYGGANPGIGFDNHKFGYDFETIARLLGKAGFIEVARSEYMQSEHASLRVDHFSAVAGARYGDRYYSLFVEAS